MIIIMNNFHDNYYVQTYYFMMYLPTPPLAGSGQIGSIAPEQIRTVYLHIFGVGPLRNMPGQKSQSSQCIFFGLIT